MVDDQGPDTRSGNNAAEKDRERQSGRKERRKRGKAEAATSRLPEMRFPLSFVGGSAREKEICQRYSAARLRERELQKEEVRACVSPTMYSAVTFRAHNNGPRWWNGTHGFWMGRTAHWTSCSVAHILRPTLSTSPPSSILHAIFRSVSPYHRDRTADEQLRIPIPTICVHVSPYHW